MQLKTLVKQANDLRQQRRVLEQQDQELAQRLGQIEAQISAIANNTGQDYENLSEEEFQMLLSELGDDKRINIEVVYADREQQIINELQVPEGATIEDGIVLSGILDRLPQIQLSASKVGIYGAVKPLTEILREGDRVEIYRPVNG